MTVEQKRVLHTAIPGPASQALHERRRAAVAAGVGSTLPVYIEQAGGGILVDVDGNHLIDLGSGLGVATGVGNAADGVVDAGAASRSPKFTHSCFMLTPYELYLDVVAAKLQRGDARRPTRSARLLLNSGAEAVENAVKIARRGTPAGRPWSPLTTPTTAAPT